MKTNLTISRRALLAGLAIAPAAVSTFSAAAEGLPKMTVTKDPNCGCCTGWVEHLHKAGFTADVVETSEINRVKVRLGVP